MPLSPDARHWRIARNRPRVLDLFLQNRPPGKLFLIIANLQSGV